MAKQRYLNTKFWDDRYVRRLSKEGKLLFLYLLTNPLTNIAGIYEIEIERIEFDTGLAADEITTLFKLFEKDHKIMYLDGWVAVKNFIRHQSTSSVKVQTGIVTELKRIPFATLEQIVRKLYGIDRVSRDMHTLWRDIIYLNPNSNLNSDPNSSPENSEILKKSGQLGDKMRIKKT
jgi:hypothetical protein